VYEVGKKISGALQKLEKTARDILKSNLRKLRQNNRIRKV
jgi:mRNA-degrading endonuclease RelE of RelBE toxin-antitoxin system